MTRWDSVAGGSAIGLSRSGKGRLKLPITDDYFGFPLAVQAACASSHEPRAKHGMQRLIDHAIA